MRKSDIREKVVSVEKATKRIFKNLEQIQAMIDEDPEAKLKVPGTSKSLGAFQNQFETFIRKFEEA